MGGRDRTRLWDTDRRTYSVGHLSLVQSSVIVRTVGKDTEKGYTFRDTGSVSGSCTIGLAGEGPGPARRETLTVPGNERTRRVPRRYIRSERVRGTELMYVQDRGRHSQTS